MKESQTVSLIMNDYLNDDAQSARQVIFTVTKKGLLDYLIEMKDKRTVEEFLETYTDKDAEYLYGYAGDEGELLSSDKITYCEDFIQKYNDFIKRTKIFNPNMSAKQITSKEDYYFTVYRPVKLCLKYEREHNLEYEREYNEQEI